MQTVLSMLQPHMLVLKVQLNDNKRKWSRVWSGMLRRCEKCKQAAGGLFICGEGEIRWCLRLEKCAVHAGILSVSVSHTHAYFESQHMFR